jgi:NAD(P)H-hydrate epimerase
MENAGRAVFDAAAARFGPAAGRSAVVLSGPGNNGSDGLVTARHLHDHGWRVTIYLVNRTLTGDAKEQLLRERGVANVALADDPSLDGLDSLLREADLAVDAVFGTGRLRPLAGPVAAVLDRLSALDERGAVLALDVPSGVNADTGAADPRAVRASITVTLGFPKRGLVLGEAVEHTGPIDVVDIGIPLSLGEALPLQYATIGAVSSLLPKRPRSSHKGTFGRVLIVAGSRLYTGAPVLAAFGAERVGAGLVTLACPESIRPSLAVHTLETTFLPLPDDGSGELGPGAVAPLTASLPNYAAVLVGPGIGRSSPTRAFLEQFLPALAKAGQPVVVDADGLTLLASFPDWSKRLPPGTVLTPHTGEMARLTGPRPDVDRLTLATGSAAAWQHIVVLKGAYTVIARPDGAATVLPFANPALATAGTGDVLAGAIVGFLGQGLAPADASVAAGFVHGLAGETVLARRGPAGGVAHEVADSLPDALTTTRSAARSLPWFGPGW